MSKKQLWLLILAIIILTILSLVVLFQKDIMYLIFSSKNNSIPRNENYLSNQPRIVDASDPDYDKGNVELKSEIARYDFVNVSRKELVDLLYSWGIYDKKYDLKEFGKNTGGVNNVVFILTNDPIKKDSLWGISRYWGQSSVEVNAKDSELEVKIYFSEDSFGAVKSHITEQALYGLYLISHPRKHNENILEIEDEFNKLVDEIKKDGPAFNIAIRPA